MCAQIKFKKTSHLLVSEFAVGINDLAVRVFESNKSLSAHVHLYPHL